MRLIYAQGFSKSEKLEWKPVIFNNVVQSMRLIFDAMNDCKISFENKDNEVSSHGSRSKAIATHGWDLANVSCGIPETMEMLMASSSGSLTFMPTQMLTQARH